MVPLGPVARLPSGWLIQLPLVGECSSFPVSSALFWDGITSSFGYMFLLVSGGTPVPGPIRVRRWDGEIKLWDLSIVSENGQRDGE